MSETRDWTQVCPTSELLPGEFKTLWLGDVPVAVYNIDGAYYAIEDICTHDGGDLAGGDIDGFSIECVRHGARFDVRTGEALCGPAYTPTAVLDVRVAEDQVFVRDPRN
jgi:3-phenylpropionate/trans-cinnamate dioxygenase ferredoxin component